ncbi:MAG: antitoxin component [Bacteriophage sp.]|nr:MAG: antitoxin component [Bacteriophage sp.]
MQGNITDWGKEVKKGLIERGWSINDLAERIGKSRTRVSGVVNGRIYSDSIASAISDLLNIEKASASMKEATRDWCMDVRKAMIDLDMNTGELAEKTGYSTQYLNAIICGRCYSPPVMKVINGALGIQEYQGKQDSSKDS